MEQDQPKEPIKTVMNEEQIAKKGFPAKTLLLIIVLGVVAFSLTAFAIFNKPKPVIEDQAIVTQQKQIDNPIQTVLTISSNVVKLSTPSAFTTDVLINSGQNPVNKVQLEISYDPKFLTKIDITPGPFFEDPKVFIKNIDPINGRVSFAFGVQENQKGIVGQGVLAKINFSVILNSPSASSSAIKLLPKTQVNADGFSESVLKTTIDALFDVSTFIPKSTISAK